MTQRSLAEHVGIHVSQIRRYEGGDSSPTLDVLRKLAVALSVSADTLVSMRTSEDPTRICGFSSRPPPASQTTRDTS